LISLLVTPGDEQLPPPPAAAVELEPLQALSAGIASATAVTAVSQPRRERLPSERLLGETLM
jgi:hypothetical protein